MSKDSVDIFVSSEPKLNIDRAIYGVWIPQHRFIFGKEISGKRYFGELCAIDSALKYIIKKNMYKSCNVYTSLELLADVFNDKTNPTKFIDFVKRLKKMMSDSKMNFRFTTIYNLQKPNTYFSCCMNMVINYCKYVSINGFEEKAQPKITKNEVVSKEIVEPIRKPRKRSPSASSVASVKSVASNRVASTNVASARSVASVRVQSPKRKSSVERKPRK